MRMHPFHRTELLLGQEGFARLQGAHLCVIGLGGVGSYAAEALARAGVGQLTLIDFDRVCITNLNRQLHATRATVNQPKAQVMAERVSAINPKCQVDGRVQFYNSADADSLLNPGYDYVLDCIDNMTAKVHLLASCVQRGLPIISAMGAGGRTDPTRIRVSDLSTTRVDPFARIVRQLLREQGIERGIDCVWTDEPPNDLDQAVAASFRCICPHKDQNTVHTCEERRQIQGTVPWMPSIFGLMMSGAVVNQMLGRPMSDGRKPVAHRKRKSR